MLCHFAKQHIHLIPFWMARTNLPWGLFTWDDEIWHMIEAEEQEQSGGDTSVQQPASLPPDGLVRYLMNRTGSCS